MSQIPALNDYPTLPWTSTFVRWDWSSPREEPNVPSNLCEANGWETSPPGLGGVIRCAVSHSVSQHVSPCTQHVMLLMAQELQVALFCGTSLVEKRGASSVWTAYIKLRSVHVYVCVYVNVYVYVNVNVNVYVYVHVCVNVYVYVYVCVYLYMYMWMHM